MMTFKISFRLILICFLSQVVSFETHAQDGQSDSIDSDTKKDLWSQWRGPARDGSVRKGTVWPENLSEDSFEELWRVELGPSYSGPIVSENLVFTTETRDKKFEVVSAYDRKTGEKRWEYSWTGAMEVPFFAKANGSWIRSTPAYDGECLYVAGMRDVLVCLNADDGQLRWKVDFVEKLDTPLPQFGFVCSPLLDGDYIYVQAGAGFCKLNKKTGEIDWRTLIDGGGMQGSAFSSPIMTEIHGTKQLLVQTRNDLTGVDPADGKVIWKETIPSYRGMNILTPTVIDNKVFTSSYRNNSWMFDISAGQDTTTAKQAWTNRAAAYMSSPVVVDGHIYMHLQNQRFTCIDSKTGKTMWTTKPYGKYWSMVYNNDRILALDERGELLLIKANPQKFELIDSRKVSQSSAWAHLASDRDQVFVRSLDALVAYQWQKTPE